MTCLWELRQYLWMLISLLILREANLFHLGIAAGGQLTVTDTHMHRQNITAAQVSFLAYFFFNSAHCILMTMH